MMAAFSLLPFFDPTLSLRSGRSVRLTGQGPPVVFSPGLHGRMPLGLYGELIGALKPHVTVITATDFQPMTADDVVDIADAITADKVSFLGHSYFDASVLASARVHRAVICDPVTIPSVRLLGGFEPIEVRAECDTLFIKADKSYTSSKYALPDYLTPRVTGPLSECTMKGAGHIDLLDDAWSNWARGVGFWDGITRPLVPYGAWRHCDRKKQEKSVNRARSAYRRRVSARVRRFLLWKDPGADSGQRTADDKGPEGIKK